MLCFQGIAQTFHLSKVVVREGAAENFLFFFFVVVVLWVLFLKHLLNRMVH